MKKLEGDYPLYNENIFSLDRLGSTSNFEGGTSATIDLIIIKNLKVMN